LVKKRFGEGQPPFDGHHYGHATGAQSEEPPEDAAAAEPHVLLGAGETDGHEQLAQHAGERYAIVGGQAPQHEPVFLVAAGPRPVQDEQRQQVAEYADGVRHDVESQPVRDRRATARRRHRRVQWRRRCCHVRRHGQLHRIAIVFCGPSSACDSRGPADGRRALLRRPHRRSAGRTP